MENLLAYLLSNENPWEDVPVQEQEREKDGLKMSVVFDGVFPFTNVIEW